MSRWTVKSPTLLVLGIVVFLMLVIVVLPDVDLPDTAFHRGTAPVVVHAQATSAPASVIVASVIQGPRFAQRIFARHRTAEFTLISDPNFRPFLLCSIRC